LAITRNGANINYIEKTNLFFGTLFVTEFDICNGILQINGVVVAWSVINYLFGIEPGYISFLLCSFLF